MVPKPTDDSPAEDPARAMGRRIQQARRAAGYRTAQQFAEDLAISVWTVHSWESGKSQPRYDMLGAIARLTDHPLAHFLGESHLQLEVPDDQAPLEAGVYGVAPYNQAAAEALTALTEAAQGWGLLLRFTAPVVATAPHLTSLHTCLEQLRGSP